MKKLVLSAVLAISLVSAVSAQGWFVGGEGNYNFKSEIDITLPNGTYSVSDSTLAIGVKGGYDFDNWRVYGAYIRNTKSSNKAISGSNSANWKGQDYIIGADWTPKINVFKQDLKAIVGGFVGHSNLDTSIRYGSYYLSYDENGFLYGLRLGGIYQLAKSHEIEFGFKFSQASYDITSGYVRDDIERTNMGLFAGYNYKF